MVWKSTRSDALDFLVTPANSTALVLTVNSIDVVNHFATPGPSSGESTSGVCLRTLVPLLLVPQLGIHRFFRCSASRRNCLFCSGVGSSEDESEVKGKFVGVEVSNLFSLIRCVSPVSVSW